MFCRKKDATLVDMSKGANKFCSGSKCGGWRWVGSSCSPGDMSRCGIRGAWLPAVEVCRVFIWGASRIPVPPRLLTGGSSSSASGPEYQYESSSDSSEPESSSSASGSEYQYESSSSSSSGEQVPSSSSESGPLFFFVQQPQNASTTAGSFEAALFYVAVSAPGGVVYAWQWSLDGGNTWYDINPDGGVFFQANTDTIGVNPGMTDISSTWNGSRFRAKVTFGPDTIFSDPAVLAVNP